MGNKASRRQQQQQQRPEGVHRSPQNPPSSPPASRSDSRSDSSSVSSEHPPAAPPPHRPPPINPSYGRVATRSPQLGSGLCPTAALLTLTAERDRLQRHYDRQAQALNDLRTHWVEIDAGPGEPLDDYLASQRQAEWNQQMSVLQALERDLEEADERLALPRL